VSGSTGGLTPAWYDPEDERRARAAWSRLVEPGDTQARQFLDDHGPGPALRLLVEGGPPASPDVARVQPRWRVRLDQVDPVRDLAGMARCGGRVVIPGDDEWPLRLDDLAAARPLCLWVRGPAHLGEACARSVAVVGARTSTYYGQDLTAGIVTGCADAGFTVVSGGAYGIDGAAHRAALATEGATVAVLACGVDRFYPRGHERLLAEITERYAVVSEVPPGSAPTRWRFLERNRLIAAMTSATVVVEAGWRSGAQNTAGHALELGRPVGACPGPVTSAMSAGCHRLLRRGATCVCDASEVLELAGAVGEFTADEPATPAAVHDDLSPDQVQTLDFVPLRSPRSLDVISRNAALEPATARRALAHLAALGLVEQVAGRWVRTGAHSGSRHRASP
jgi:DNA processing protein